MVGSLASCYSANHSCLLSYWGEGFTQHYTERSCKQFYKFEFNGNVYFRTGIVYIWHVYHKLTVTESVWFVFWCDLVLSSPRSIPIHQKVNESYPEIERLIPIPALYFSHGVCPYWCVLLGFWMRIFNGTNHHPNVNDYSRMVHVARLPSYVRRVLFSL